GDAPDRSDYPLGQMGGAEQITLLSSQMGPHSHGLLASLRKGGTWPPPPYPPAPDFPPAPGPGMALAVATQDAVKVYGTDTPYVALGAASISIATSGNLPHENRQPYLAINYIICVQGIWPPR